MKKILTFIGVIAVVFGVVVGALIMVDRFKNKNRIKDGYLDCDVPDAEVIED